MTRLIDVRTDAEKDVDRYYYGITYPGPIARTHPKLVRCGWCGHSAMRFVDDRNLPTGLAFRCGVCNRNAKKNFASDCK